MPRPAFRVLPWLILLAACGCTGTPPAVDPGAEDGLNARRPRSTGTLAFTDVALVGPNGAPIDGVGIRVAGASYPVVKGKARIPTDLVDQARAAGGLKIEGPGGQLLTATFGPDGTLAPITLAATAAGAGDQAAGGGATGGGATGGGTTGAGGAAGGTTGAAGRPGPVARPTNGSPEEAAVRAKLPDYVGLRPATTAGGTPTIPDNGPVGLVSAIDTTGARPMLHDATRGVTVPLAQLVTAPRTTLVAGGSGEVALAEAPALASVPSDGPGFIANNGSGVIPTLGIVGDNGGGLISDGGGMLTGAAYFPFEPIAAKLRLLQIGPPALEASRQTATGLVEHVWPNQSRVRAILADGAPLTDWVPCVGDGTFQLPLPAVCPAVIFLQAEITTPDPADGGSRRAYALAFAPGAKKTSQVPVDASTTMVATSTLHLVNYIPPEHGRVGGLGTTWEGKAVALEAQIEGAQEVNWFEPTTTLAPPRFYGLMQAPPPPPPKPTKAQLLAALASANGYVGSMEGRSGDLAGAWAGFNPFMYGADLYGADEAVTPASAVAIAKAQGLRPTYDTMYDLALNSRFWPWSFWAIAPDTPAPPD